MRFVAALSTLGLLTSLAVLTYGVLVLRPGDDSRVWITHALERTDRIDDVTGWSSNFQQRLGWLLVANVTLDKHVARIRKGIFTQLCFAMFVFVVSIQF